VLQQARGLSPPELQAIADLEGLVVGADGGRLKLEWGSLRSRDRDQVQDLLWWQDGQLLGFLGMYRFGSSTELTGMVAPAARRRGIATALLTTALSLCADRGHHRPLLVVPRTSAAGKAMALGRGAVLDHSEHALVLLAEPGGGASDPRVCLREAVPADALVVSQLLEEGFGHPATGVAEMLASDQERALLVEVDASPVGTLRLTHQGDDAGIYGFVVAPAWRGQGIGRDVLRRVCQQLRAEGARRIGLEVAVDNDRALGLYISVGFTSVATEDYYALPVPQAVIPSNSPAIRRGRR
jgi:ribosomal protein S18 acetylase RimI-like enzyme